MKRGASLALTGQRNIQFLLDQASVLEHEVRKDGTMDSTYGRTARFANTTAVPDSHDDCLGYVHEHVAPLDAPSSSTATVGSALCITAAPDEASLTQSSASTSSHNEKHDLAGELAAGNGCVLHEEDPPHLSPWNKANALIEKCIRHGTTECNGHLFEQIRDIFRGTAVNELHGTLPDSDHEAEDEDITDDINDDSDNDVIQESEDLSQILDEYNALFGSNDVDDYGSYICHHIGDPYIPRHEQGPAHNVCVDEMSALEVECDQWVFKVKPHLLAVGSKSEPDFESPTSTDVENKADPKSSFDFEPHAHPEPPMLSHEFVNDSDVDTLDAERPAEFHVDRPTPPKAMMVLRSSSPPPEQPDQRHDRSTSRNDAGGHAHTSAATTRPSATARPTATTARPTNPEPEPALDQHLLGAIQQAIGRRMADAGSVQELLGGRTLNIVFNVSTTTRPEQLHALSVSVRHMDGVSHEVHIRELSSTSKSPVVETFTVPDQQPAGIASLSLRDRITVLISLAKSASYVFKWSTKSAPHGYRKHCDVCDKPIEGGHVHGNLLHRNLRGSLTWSWDSCAKCTPDEIITMATDSSALQPRKASSRSSSGRANSKPSSGRMKRGKKPAPNYKSFPTYNGYKMEVLTPRRQRQEMAALSWRARPNAPRPKAMTRIPDHPDAKAEVHVPQSDIICFGCGMIGHQWKDCPRPDQVKRRHAMLHAPTWFRNKLHLNVHGGRHEGSMRTERVNVVRHTVDKERKSQRRKLYDPKSSPDFAPSSRTGPEHLGPEDQKRQIQGPGNIEIIPRAISHREDHERGLWTQTGIVVSETDELTDWPQSQRPTSAGIAQSIHPVPTTTMKRAGAPSGMRVPRAARRSRRTTPQVQNQAQARLGQAATDDGLKVKFGTSNNRENEANSGQQGPQNDECSSPAGSDASSATEDERVDVPRSRSSTSSSRAGPAPSQARSSGHGMNEAQEDDPARKLIKIEPRPHGALQAPINRGRAALEAALQRNLLVGGDVARAGSVLNTMTASGAPASTCIMQVAAQDATAADLNLTTGRARVPNGWTRTAERTCVA